MQKQKRVYKNHSFIARLAAYKSCRVIFTFLFEEDDSESYLPKV